MLGELSDLVSDYLSINPSLIPGETIATGISKGIYAVAKKSKIFRFSYNNDSIELEMDTKKLDKVAKGNNFFSYVVSVALYMKENYSVSGVDINVRYMTLPIRKGLSSSAAVSVLTVKAFKKKNKANTETSLIESFVYPKLGTIQMWNEMANKIKSLGGKIYLNTIVKNIVIKDNTVEAVIYEKDNITYTENLDIVISSMPIKELFEGFRNSNIPEDIYDIATNLPYRDFMSVGLVVNKLTLQNKTKSKTLGNILPDSWIYIQEPDITMGRLQIFNNWSPYMFKDKTEMDKKVILGLEYFASEDDKYWNMSDKEFIDFAIGEAEKIGLLNRSDVEESIRIKIPKAYPAYFGTYSDIDRVITYLNTISNLYCIGRNGQHRYNNMDHSMLTGIETANHIMNKLENKQIIWNVNTEQEYHETKVN